MELIVVDNFLLLISLVLATAIVAIYVFLTSFVCLKLDCIEAVPVHDIIKTLKKVCPVDFGNKWSLLPVDAGSSRCWTKTVQFPGFQNNITLYGTACAVACSSLYAFSLLVDVTKWGEWEPLPSAQCLLLKPFCDNKLKKDALMQADQVVGIQKGADVQSYIAMYRFMNLSEKTVKWILFWNAKKLEFMFFLIQPAINKTVDSQCVITHIFGTKPASSSQLPSTIAQRMRNIKDFLHLSQVHIIASKYTTAIPAVSTHSSCHKLGLECQPNKATAKSTADCFQHIFMLVPIISHLNGVFSRLKGFKLAVREIDDESTTKKEKKKDSSVAVQSVPSVEENLPNEKLKRSVSDACIKPKKHADFSSSLDLNSFSSKEKSSIIAKASNTKRNSVIVEENFKFDLNCNEKTESARTSFDPNKVRSFSEPSGSNVEKSKTSSGSETHTDEDIYVNLHIIHESVSQENVSSIESCSKSDYFGSSTSDFELVESNQFLDCRLAEFLTQGNYAASELQFEMMQASHFDKSSPEQRGCWIFNSTCKGITVLSKTTAGQFMKVESYLCQVGLPYNAEDVWKCVKNPRFRFIYDETVKTVKIVERISESQKLIHVYNEASAFIKKEGTDFCLLQTERKEANLFYSSFHSIEYEKCPFMEGVLRGTLKPSGWVVENLGSHKCKVTHLIQMIVSSSDNVYINQLSSLVPLAIHNLKNYLGSRPSRK